ncbi:TPA: hypothetical protein DD449_02715 [Candidatus Berkelbacteria bacterium]|uniref:SCP domain-containing protein n=1 Tax=Berkelbacteria bacterium GW2011_GWE1_39_12 TaxID=1618337 RepID=A0A0G4B384_9BACT|nr:MAG: hypothetical protein UT28_C0001G0229 [Berkelbacteria bacterium GW2011_GWE1_39_12]HBO60569.1 hypothetical protein [Candidatus Berkelbacteria bacterium]
MPNWIDFIIITVFVIYVWDGYRRGFLRLAWEFAGLLFAFAFALKFYPNLEQLLKDIHFSDSYTRPVSFLTIWFLSQMFFYIIGKYLSYYTPSKLKESAPNHYFGLFPAALKGIVFIAVLLILFMIMPIWGGLKSTISKSLIGGYLIHQTARIEAQVETVFAGVNGTVGYLTSNPVLDQTSKLDFTTTDTAIDGDSEKQMFAMVNLERAKEGLVPLAEDILIRNVARVKSRDMLIRGYFAHESPTGEVLLDRLNNAHVEYIAAAENIALAPTIDLAQIGLMNSPKHKANILDPSFTKMGVGVIETKDHGIMVTQIFAR